MAHGKFPAWRTRSAHTWLEFRRVGNYIKVSAINPVTNTEVSIVGAASATQAELERIAVNKLKYVLAKNERDNGL